MTAESPPLQRFDGPLDLLLELITRRTLDITTISLAAVAEEYLAEVGRLAEVDLERLSAYLVIASRLLLIKSRALLPRPQVDENPDEDEGLDLVRQLEEYQQFKAIAKQLRTAEETNRKMFPRSALLPTSPRPAAGAGRPTDLVSALCRALAAVPALPRPELVAVPKYSVAQKARQLHDMVNRSGEVNFCRLVAGASCRYEVIAYFLALLELLRRGIFNVPGGKFYLSLAHSDDDLARTLEAFEGALKAIAGVGQGSLCEISSS